MDKNSKTSKKILIYKEKSITDIDLVKNANIDSVKWVIETFNLFIEDADIKDIIGKDGLKSFIFSLDAPEDFLGLSRQNGKDVNISIFDIKVNGLSMIKNYYDEFNRFIGIINRNSPYKTIQTKIKTFDFWQISASEAREIVKKRHPTKNDDVSREQMDAFSRITHEKASVLWSLTHGISFYVTPYELDVSENEVIFWIDKELDIYFKFNDMGYLTRNGFNYIEISK